MKINMKHIAISVVVASIICIGPSVYAYPGDDSRMHGPFMQRMHEFKERIIENLIEELEITPEQQEEIKSTRAKLKEKTKSVYKNLREQLKTLREELEQTDVDQRKVKKTAAKIKALQAQALDLRIEGILAVKEILTDEQYQQLQAKKKKAREFFKKRIKERKELREELGF